ncbi:MAG: preprotein translocase subunit YajC [Desertimonas sp.]
MHILTVLAAEEQSSGGSLLGMLPLLALPLLAYFVLIRPNRRRMREQQDMQSGLEVGDEIITNSGIYGFITGFDGDRVWVEVDDDVQLRMARAAIQGKIDTSEPGDAAAGGTAAGDAAETGDESEPSTADNGAADE